MLSRSVDPGQIAASTLLAPVLFTVAKDPTKMELRVEFDGADIGLVRVGQSTEFSVDAYDYRRFPAEIIQVRFAPETVDGVVTYTAILTIDNSDLSLRPGMTKTVDIIVAHVANELVVPNGDLQYAPPEDAPDDKTNNRSGLLGMLIPDSPEQSRTQANNRTIWVLDTDGPREVSITPRLSDGKITEVTSESFTRSDIVIFERIDG